MSDFTYQKTITKASYDSDALILLLGDKPGRIESYYQAALELNHNQFRNAKRLLGAPPKIYRKEVETPKGIRYTLHLSDRYGVPYYHQLKTKQAKSA